MQASTIWQAHLQHSDGCPVAVDPRRLIVTALVGKKRFGREAKAPNAEALMTFRLKALGCALMSVARHMSAVFSQIRSLRSYPRSVGEPQDLDLLIGCPFKYCDLLCQLQMCSRKASTMRLLIFRITLSVNSCRSILDRYLQGFHRDSITLLLQA